MSPALNSLGNAVARVYGDGAQAAQERFSALCATFTTAFGRDAEAFFSAPGRTELGGNHTDHNNGRVLAAAVDLDTIAAVAPRDDEVIEVRSLGYPEPFCVNISSNDPVADERGTSSGLIRGVAAGFLRRGGRIGGFSATVSSTVLPGSGLSSSASFEVLIGAVLNNLFNDDKFSPVEIAKIGRYAENEFFGKPCGLMDQIACAHGGVVSIDFRDIENPTVESAHCDFRRQGYTLVVVDSGGDHADLTPEYAAVPAEMKAVAAEFGADLLAEVDPAEFRANIARARRAAGDRAVLRAIHFFADTERVVRQRAALEANAFSEYLALVNESGSSSWRFLQNCRVPGESAQQNVALALGVTEDFLDRDGAVRVHGGGFAGTIQAYVPTGRVREYTQLMETLCGAGSVTALKIREIGATRL